LYTESFFGCSTYGHSRARTLARYLSLLFQSDFFRWHALLTSSKLGVERDSLLKEDVVQVPLRPLEEIPETLSKEIKPLSDALFEEDSGVWPDIDSWIARCFDLNYWDCEVVRDTLAVALPFSEAKANAQRPPEAVEVEAFANRVESELQPFVRAAAKTLRVKRLSQVSATAPWEVVVVTTHGNHERRESIMLAELYSRADREGASQILVIGPERDSLWLAILRQYRYWTPTRARLTALEILKEHLGALLGTA
jgi:hypothetical protein